MKITKNKIATLDYTLKNDKGDIINTSDKDGPIMYLHGYENLIPGLENALENREKGESFEISVLPEQGYGNYDENLIITVKKKDLELDEEIELGMELEARTEDSTQLFYVSELDGDDVTLDGNHPLAGMTLFFTIKIIDVRDATTEEIEHQHVHMDDN